MPTLEPMQQPPSRSGGRRARVMRVSTSLAEINVVPLVDVMLVLLVIFMVAAPMMQQGFAVQLPKSSRGQAISEPVTITVPVTFRKNQKVRIGSEWVDLSVLEERVRQALDGQLQKNVILAGDGEVTIQEVVTIRDRLVDAGVKAMTIQVQPGPGGR
jgi:biopolymer transport protein ExbD